jgi:hypothetical protein
MDSTFVCTSNMSTELHAGRHVVVKNISAADPVPEGVAGCLRPFPGPVVDPYIIDAAREAREMREAAALWAEKPPHHYVRADMKRLFGADDHGINALMDGYACPRPRMIQMVSEGAGLAIGSFEQWEGRKVDEWVARLRPLISGLFATRKAAK